MWNKSAAGNEAQFMTAIFTSSLNYWLTKNSLKTTTPAAREKNLKQAATFIVKLETNQPDMGAEHLKKRYEDLLAKEPLLKEAYLK